MSRETSDVVGYELGTLNLKSAYNWHIIDVVRYDLGLAFKVR